MVYTCSSPQPNLQKIIISMILRQFPSYLTGAFELQKQIASFIKTHIFSRRRPIDGWKYMIEEIGPNARRGKGSVQRLPSITDASTQPYKEEKPAIGLNLNSRRGR